MPETNRLQHINSFRDIAAILRATRGGVAWQARRRDDGRLRVRAAYAREREQFGRPIGGSSSSRTCWRSRWQHHRVAGHVVRLAELQDAGIYRTSTSRWPRRSCTARMREVVGVGRELSAATASCSARHRPVLRRRRGALLVRGHSRDEHADRRPGDHRLERVRRNGGWSARPRRRGGRRAGRSAAARPEPAPGPGRRERGADRPGRVPARQALWRRHRAARAGRAGRAGRHRRGRRIRAGAVPAARLAGRRNGRQVARASGLHRASHGLRRPAGRGRARRRRRPGAARPCAHRDPTGGRRFRCRRPAGADGAGSVVRRHLGHARNPDGRHAARPRPGGRPVGGAPRREAALVGAVR